MKAEPPVKVLLYRLTLLPSVSLSSLYPASLTLTKSVFCYSPDDETVASKPELNQPRFEKDTTGDRSIFFGDKKRDKDFSTDV